jgi:phosphoribosylformylglycinamidine synthase
VLRAAGLGACSSLSSAPNEWDEVRVTATPSRAARKARGPAACLVGNQLSHAVLRDNPECAQQEYDRILDAGDPACRPR